MKYIALPLIISLLISLSGCRKLTDNNKIIKDIEAKIESGNLKSAIHTADSVKRLYGKNAMLFRKVDSLSQIAERTGIDFSVSEEQVIKQINKRIGAVSANEKDNWEKKGWLEWRSINGVKMYFTRAASNLMLIRKFYENKEGWLRDIATDSAMIFRLKHTQEVVNTSDNQHNPVAPVKMTITYTLTVKPDVVPDGEIIRCWLPWPKESHPRQQEVRLLTASNPEFKIAPDSAIHRTLYMEGKAKSGTPTVFSISYSYFSYAQYFNLKSLAIAPYNRSSDIYKKYTSEQYPQIRFTPEIRRLADSITSPGDNPDEIVKKIYLWFKNNILWTGALEYSIMPDIPGYVLKNRRGDCGMQVFLFISMLRYKGIPVHWQSGWMLPPGAENLHDWCEVYYEGTGWVPVDISYDQQDSGNNAIKDFYISGIDSYRLIVNDGVSGPLHPAKQYMRSEPYDFQRGEVEWKGGNLYFEKWNYDMKIEYLK
jgi:hypothetical protein